MRRAVRLGLLALERDRVDGDDPGGAGDPGALDRVDADATDDLNCDRVTDLDLRPVDR
jgi:hypothetical protein